MQIEALKDYYELKLKTIKYSFIKYRPGNKIIEKS